MLSLGASLAWAQDASAPVHLTVTSEPAEASVFVRYTGSRTEERFIGRTSAQTPLELDLERAGPAEVVIVKNGFVAKVETLELRSGGECFVLQIKGDSMIEAGILDGDWVVIEKRQQARDGEIVVALTDGENATLKRLKRLPDKVLLIPENCDMAPMEFEPSRVEIQGVLVGQMRAYS